MLETLEPASYACARDAVDALRGAGAANAYPYRERYLNATRWIGQVADEHAVTMTPCELARHLTVLAWYETVLTPARGQAGEYGITQVLPCMRVGRPCGPGYDKRVGVRRTRPDSHWLSADPKNPLIWSAGWIQDGAGPTVERMTAYNGSGACARAYGERHLWAVGLVQRWTAGERSGPTLRKPPTPSRALCESLR